MPEHNDTDRALDEDLGAIEEPPTEDVPAITTDWTPTTSDELEADNA